jgi:hypothetical protein
LNMSPCDSIIDAPFNACWAPPRYWSMDPKTRITNT